MEDPEYHRLRHTAERMIHFVSTADDESFSMLWNSLTVHDQRAIAAAMMRTVAELRSDPGALRAESFRPHASTRRRRA